MYELGWILFGAISLFCLQCVYQFFADTDWKRPTTWVVHYSAAGFCEWRNGDVISEIRSGGATPTELLDQCVPARARLAFVDRVICQHADVEPGSYLDNMIKAAVYEGRGVYTCIETLENRSAMKETQNAVC